MPVTDVRQCHSLGLPLGTSGVCTALQECDRARELLASVQSAFPEVAQLVRTVQLSHKILFKKGAFIAELAQTGVDPSALCAGHWGFWTCMLRQSTGAPQKSWLPDGNWRSLVRLSRLGCLHPA